MTEAKRFDPATLTVGLGRDLAASLVPARPDPPIPVDGFTFGVATMTENAPHGGEMHPDGDEVLYLISGRVKVTLEGPNPEEIIVQPGDGLIVPKGVWHRVDVLEPCQIMYLTPGPRFEWRPLEDDAANQ